MQKLFMYLFNCLYWCLDCIVFLVETLVEAASLFLNFLLTASLVFARRVQRLLQYKMWKQPMVKKPFDGSYIMRGVRILAQMFARVILYFYILQAFPEIRTFLGSIGSFFTNPRIQLIASIAALFFLLPQQQLLRDPVTRVFFRRRWFKNYGTAFFFVKCLSFLIIFILFCGVIIP